MSDLYGLTFEAMPNKLVNYGTTDNGIAVIELASDSGGEPLQGDATAVNTYTHGMFRDFDDAIIEKPAKPSFSHGSQLAIWDGPPRNIEDLTRLESATDPL